MPRFQTVRGVQADMARQLVNLFRLVEAMNGVRRGECDGLQHLASLRSAVLHPRRTQSKSRTLGVAIAMRGSECRTMVCVSRSSQTRIPSACFRHFHSHEDKTPASPFRQHPHARETQDNPRGPLRGVHPTRSYQHMHTQRRHGRVAAVNKALTAPARHQTHRPQGTRRRHARGQTGCARRRDTRSARPGTGAAGGRFRACWRAGCR